MTTILSLTSRSLCAAALAGALLAALPAPLRASPSEPAEEARRKKGEAQVLERTRATEPADSLTLAAELARAGDGLAAELFRRGWPTGPAVRAATTDGAGKAARAIAARTLLRGPGLPLAGSRYVDVEFARAKASGERVPGNARDFFAQSRLSGAYLRASGLGALPKGMAPVVLAAGPDGGFRMDALGWGLLASVRLAQELGFERRVEGGTTFVGATAEAGFEGMLLLAVASGQLHALRSQLALGQGGFGEATLVEYDPFTAPRYYPHALKLVKGPDEDGGPTFEATEAQSRLGDQAALLLGCCEFARLKDLPAAQEGLSLLGPAKGTGDAREELYPLSHCALARDLARFIFRNMAALHFDPGAKSFVSEAKPGERGTRIDTADAALALIALEAAHELFADDAKLRAEVKRILGAQAAFLEARLKPDGTLMPVTMTAPGGAGPGGAAPKEPATVAAEALTVQALLAGARAGGDDKLKDAARRNFRRLEARRYDPWASLYLGDDPAAEAVITPADAAFAIGALRDLALGTKAPEAIDRLRDVVQALAKAGAWTDGEAAALRVKVARQ